LSELTSQRLLRFARSLQGVRDFGELVSAAAVEVKESLGFAHTWLMIAEDESLARFRLIAYAGTQAQQVWDVAPVLEVRGDAFLEALVASVEPFVIEDARLDPRTHKPTVEALQNRTLINLPLTLLDRPLGFLGIGTFGDEGCRAPTSSELGYLIGIASQLTVAAARVRFNQERERSEEEKLVLERRIAQMQRIESLGLLAGGVAHDFNNLLTVIMSSVSLAHTASRDPMVLADLDAALAATHRARELTTQLLAMSRSQPLQLQLLDVNVRIGQLDAMLRRIFPENVASELRLAASLPAIEGDGTQIDQVLMNLCINARDAMPDGGRLTIESERVDLNASFAEAHPWAKVGQYVLITVSDNGKGMSKATMERVFEPFFTTKASLGGTGLGLAVAYGIVSQHGGLLHAYSELGVGSTFKVYLPIAEQRRWQARAQSLPAPERGHERVLMAEDDPAVRHVTRRILESSGYDVTCANNGAAAIRCAQEQSFDLILLDVVMPGMSCEETVTQLARLQPNVAFLLASGYTAGSRVLELASTLHMRLLRKPYDPDELLQAIRDALDAREL
jgi:signal transduction histidine kinase